MKYFIALDGGGTKLDAILFDETGHIKERIITGGSNAMDIGYELAQKRLTTAVKTLGDKVGGEVEAIYCGIAGTMPMGDYVTEAVNASGIKYKHIQVGDDGTMIISAVLGQKDACCIICGTGSSCFVRRKGKRLEKMGGKGYLIDSNGSGYDLGRECLRHAFRSIDGRDGKTMLVELVGEKMGLKAEDCFPNSDWMRKIYDPQTGGRPYIAKFSTCVFEAASKGDEIAKQIIEEQSEQLASLTYAAEKFFDGDFDVVMSGGIIQNVPEYAKLVISKASPRAHLIVSDEIPVYGAAVEDMLTSGCEVTKEFHDNFVNDYNTIKGNKLDIQL